MNTWRFLLMTMLLALPVLSGGCSMFASAPETPRMDPLISLQGDIDAVRKENEQMRAFQGQQSEKIQALEKQLAQEQEAHKRYREMMATNFELLEQSVAETLSTLQPSAQTASAAAPAAMAQSGTAPQGAQGAAAMPAVATMLTPQEATAADQAATRNRQAALEAKRAADMADRQPKAAPAMVQGPARTAAPAAVARQSAAADEGRMAPPAPVVLPLAATDDRPFTDPDLTPPVEAQPLDAHPEAKALYERGFSLFAHKQYDEAVKVYTSFLQQFPSDIYSDNAQFWIGEAHLRSKRLTEAEAAYRLVLRHYDHQSTLAGAKTPDAILRIGQIKAANGDSKRAQYYFANAAERFPDSSAGRKAQQELDSLRQNTADATTVEPRS